MIAPMSGRASCSQRLIQPLLHCRQAARVVTPIVRVLTLLRPRGLLRVNGAPSRNSSAIHWAKTCSLLVPGLPQKTQDDGSALTVGRGYRPRRSRLTLRLSRPLLI